MMGGKFNFPHLSQEGEVIMERDRCYPDQGFSLIELIVVVVILGLLAGVIGPRLWNRIGESKSTVAKLQVEQFGSLLGLFGSMLVAIPIQVKVYRFW